MVRKSLLILFHLTKRSPNGIALCNRSSDRNYSTKLLCSWSRPLTDTLIFLSLNIFPTQKTSAQIHFPQKKQGQRHEENPAIARHTRRADGYVFPDEILSRHILHIMTVKWLKKTWCLFCQNSEASEAGNRVLWRWRKFALLVDRFLDPSHGQLS